MEEKHEFTDWVNLISSGKYKTETEKLAISKKLEEEQKIKHELKHELEHNNIHHATLETERDNNPCKEEDC